MSFWERVKVELKKAVDEGWVAVKEGAKIAAEKSREGAKIAAGKGEEYAKSGKLRYQAYQLHRKAERGFADLGGMVYELAKPPYENPLSNPEVMKIIEEIKTIEGEEATLEEQRKKLKHKEPPEPEKLSEPEETSETEKPGESR